MYSICLPSEKASLLLPLKSYCFLYNPFCKIFSKFMELSKNTTISVLIASNKNSVSARILLSYSALSAFHNNIT